MKRVVIACAGSVALAAGAVLAPTATAVAATHAHAAASSPPAQVVAFGAEGSNGGLYAQAPQLGSGWHSLGGRIFAAPAVVAAATPDGSAPADPLFIATGAAGKLYLRSLTAGWQPVGPSAAYCLNGPAAVITASTLTVACEGTNHALYYNTAALVSSGLSKFTTHWTSLGGSLTAGPAVAPVGTALTFFAPGVGGRVYTRTASTGFTASPWTCIGHVAAALQAAATSTTFACQGTNHAMWQAANSGTGWSAATSLGGQLINGPGIAASGQVGFFAEGSTHAVYERTAASTWASLGGAVTGGVNAAPLNTPAGAPWKAATAIPGLAALGGGAFLNSISCPSPGNCSAGGQYTDQTSGISSQAFVADEVNGTWGDAIEVPGTAALNTGDYAFVNSVSCASAGNCVTGGQYCTSPCGSPGNDQAFVADEVNGTWGDAIEVPGTAGLNVGNNAQVMSVSCPSAGNCTIGGFYADNLGAIQAFVADEVNGTWGDAIEVPGTGVLNAGGVVAEAEVESVSCSSAGNCAVGGSYVDSSANLQAFVADEVNGTWDNAIEVPGTAALNTGGSAEISSVSCTSAGNCSAGGGYSVSNPGGQFPSQTFVVSEVNGTWDNAIEVPGTAALNAGAVAFVTSVSCMSPGNCAAGGYYDDSSGARLPFVANEVNGTWDNATEVRGTVGNTTVNSVSCQSAGNCVAGGGLLSDATTQGFVVSEVNGTWDEAIQVAGIPEANSSVDSVSCPPTGGCSAGGYGQTSSGTGFVVSQN